MGLNLNFSPSDKILDLASGLGSSALFIADKFGSSVIGIDFSQNNIIKARSLANQKNLDHLVKFNIGNADNLPFENDYFDFVISECSFCLFQNKKTVGREIYRVLKPNGRVLITDIAIEKKLPFKVEEMIFQVACIANALSMDNYAKYFENCGFQIQSIEGHNNVLLQMLEDIKKMIFVAELASGLKKINLGSINLKEVKTWIQKGKGLINEGYFTYMVMIGNKI